MCESNERLLHLLDDTLSAEDKALVEDHLAQCHHCRSRLDQIEAAHQFLRAELPAVVNAIRPPEYLAMRIRHRLSHSNQPSWWQKPQNRTWAAAAAIAVLLSGSLLYVGPPRQSQPSPPAPASLSATNPENQTGRTQPTRIIVVVPGIAPQIHNLQRRDGQPMDDDALPRDFMSDLAPAGTPRTVQSMPRVHRPVLVVQPVNHQEM